MPEEAKNLNMAYIDATCPLVSKVHKEAENLYKNNYHILLIGHFNHPEVIGTMGQLPKDSIDLIERVEDANSYVKKNENRVSKAKRQGRREKELKNERKYHEEIYNRLRKTEIILQRK